MTRDVAELPDELPDAELVFALVAPLGTPLDLVQDELVDALAEHRYALETSVRISKALDGLEPGDPHERSAVRQERLMEVGNQQRAAHGADLLALMAIAAINQGRESDPKKHALPHKRAAHLIRSLKHPEEVTRLRNVYGNGFYDDGPESLARHLFA